MQDLRGNLYTNPHSGHAAWGSDISATECEAEARALTLAMCKASAEEYECIFTSGATGGLALASDCQHCSLLLICSLNLQLLLCCVCCHPCMVCDFCMPLHREDLCRG